MRKIRFFAACAFLLSISTVAHAAQPWPLGNNTRYLAMGDSLSSGYGATPVTNGYAYLLYQQGIYDQMTNTSFADAAIPGATSQQVANFQANAAVQSGFYPQVITMTVGANDLLALLSDPNAAAELPGVLATFGGNLTSILSTLCTAPVTPKIYVANLYSIQNLPPPPGVSINDAVLAFNSVVTGVVNTINGSSSPCAGRVKVVDVYSAFSGNQQGLLLINRPGANRLGVEVHPTDAGYRAMAKAFIAAK
jgi:lysophospholipase L1-like esterase